MKALVLTLFILDAIALIGLILIQMSRHAGLGGAFGAGGRYTVFGRDETRDPKRTATAWLAGGFLVLGLLLSILR